MTQPNTSSSPRYFDLHTHGIGYLNRVREVPVKRGLGFLAVDIAALHGSADDVQYTRFDCRVSGEEAQALVRNCAADIEARKAVLVAFNISDIFVETFTYGKDSPKAGQTGVSLKGRLLRIDWIRIDGQEIYRAPNKDAVVPDEVSQRREAA
jgi:hypothetical protein